MVPTAALAIVIGVILTGSGPHAGDADTPRNGLDSLLVSHYHSYPAYLLLALTLLQLVLRITKTGKKSARYSLALLGLLGFQIVLGLTQIWLGVPIILVGLHMLGASLLTSVITYQALLNRAWLGSK